MWIEYVSVGKCLFMEPSAHSSESSCPSRWIFSIQLFKVTGRLSVQLHLTNHHGHKREGMTEMAQITFWPSGGNIRQRFMSVSLENPRKIDPECPCRSQAVTDQWKVLISDQPRRWLSLWSWLGAQRSSFIHSKSTAPYFYCLLLQFSPRDDFFASLGASDGHFIFVFPPG